jgi:hypothetical protein
MRAGSGDLRDWFSSNGMPPIRFLITGAVYCVVGVTCMSAAVLLRRDNSKGRLFAMAAIVLVTLDMLADLYRKRSIGFNLDGLVETTLTLALLLVTAVYLAQRRRPPE